MDCFPATVEPAAPGAPGPDSGDILTAAQESVAAGLGGRANPNAVTSAVEAHFAALNLEDRAIIRATVERIPEGEARRAVLESGHHPEVEVSDEEGPDDPGSDPEDEASREAMWPAQRDVV
eukprot:5312874-Alexandrium_andersonii.AAC.1